MKTKITACKVKLWLADNKEIAFIDLREISQHSDGHPFFSISIPYSVFELNLEVLVPNKKTRLILIDNNNEISKEKYKENEFKKKITPLLHFFKQQEAIKLLFS